MRPRAGGRSSDHSFARPQHYMAGCVQDPRGMRRPRPETGGKSMNTDLLVALAAGLPGALFAVWIVLTGEASIRRARN